MNLIMLITALCLSAVAAYYSIAGLVAIFSTAVIPIIIMGVTLEVAKLVTASWVYRNWNEIPFLLKSYFTSAVAILMLLTSMGIFGFLSKAHMDQGITVGDSSAQVTIFDEKIASERDNINAARKALQQMDNQVDQMLGRTDTEKGAERAVQIRRNQAKERKALQNEISQSQKTITALQAERAPIAAENRKIEADVGPIKYIAALVYGDNPDANLLERAVRWVIIMIVSVFDPLAVLMLVGYNWSVKRKSPETWPPHDPDFLEPIYEEDDGPLTDEQIDKIKEASGINQDRVDARTRAFFKRGRKLAKKIDENGGKIPKDFSPDEFLDSIDDTLGVKTIEEEVDTLQKSKKPIEYDSVGRRMTP